MVKKINTIDFVHNTKKSVRICNERNIDNLINAEEFIANELYDDTIVFNAHVVAKKKLLILMTLKSFLMKIKILFLFFKMVLWYLKI